MIYQIYIENKWRTVKLNTWQNWIGKKRKLCKSKIRRGYLWK